MNFGEALECLKEGRQITTKGWGDAYIQLYEQDDTDVVHKIASLRNKRIKTTQNMTATNESMYHLVTREPGKMNIIETPMHLIDMDSIREEIKFFFKSHITKYIFHIILFI